MKAKNCVRAGDDEAAGSLRGTIGDGGVTVLAIGDSR